MTTLKFTQTELALFNEKESWSPGSGQKLMATVKAQETLPTGPTQDELKGEKIYLHGVIWGEDLYDADFYNALEDDYGDLMDTWSCTEDKAESDAALAEMQAVGNRLAEIVRQVEFNFEFKQQYLHGQRHGIQLTGYKTTKGELK